jgi:monoterpene epsilon-lactone hydrolase
VGEPMIEALTRWLSLRAYGVVTSSLFRASTRPQSMRRRFERYGATTRDTMLRRHPHLVFTDHAIGALAIESVRASASPRRTILYLHGGAFVMGSPASYRSRAARLAYRCDAEVFVPDYRLAPEHPFPAALDDAAAAWLHLRARECGRPMFVAGDSAGGGLALALMLELRRRGERQPAGAVLLSPWADFRKRDVGVHHRDLWLTPTHLDTWARSYLGGADPQDPRVSPALADLAELAPMLVLVGADELLAADARRIVTRAQASATDARLLIGKGMQHDWPLTLPWLEESRHAWQAIASFIDELDRGDAAATRSSVSPHSPTRNP